MNGDDALPTALFAHSRAPIETLEASIARVGESFANRNASDEEVEAVADLVARLTAPGSQWIDEDGVAKEMTGGQILAVAP